MERDHKKAIVNISKLSKLLDHSEKTMKSFYTVVNQEINTSSSSSDSSDSLTP